MPTAWTWSILGDGGVLRLRSERALDVYIATNMLADESESGGRRGYMFQNQGDGTFLNVTEKAGIALRTRSHSATWWDWRRTDGRILTLVPTTASRTPSTTTTEQLNYVHVRHLLGGSAAGTIRPNLLILIHSSP